MYIHNISKFTRMWKCDALTWIKHLISYDMLLFISWSLHFMGIQIPKTMVGWPSAQMRYINGHVYDLKHHEIYENYSNYMSSIAHDQKSCCFFSDHGTMEFVKCGDQPIIWTIPWTIHHWEAHFMSYMTSSQIGVYRCIQLLPKNMYSNIWGWIILECKPHF